MPQVHLHGGDPEAGPISSPAPARHDECPRRAIRIGPRRLQLFGEIARGGMGVVLKGRDPDLGRDLASRSCSSSTATSPTGPPVHRGGADRRTAPASGSRPGLRAGQLADRRPYFAMKLVRGRTLAELLADRADRAGRHPRLLGIFEQVCQTMAYAHDRGVIHRDLKPSNVMVGSFGEVQVMDWGLAKVLARSGAADEPAVRPARAARARRSTARSGSDSECRGQEA